MSAPNPAFEQASELLATQSSLTGPQARGAIRLGLKDGGLDARDVTPAQLVVVFERLMPKRLRGQGLAPDAADDICRKIVIAVSAQGVSIVQPAAASMFARLDEAARG